MSEDRLIRRIEVHEREVAEGGDRQPAVTDRVPAPPNLYLLPFNFQQSFLNSQMDMQR